MTKEFLAQGQKAKGLVWTMTELFVIVAILGFTVASWAVFKQFTWWESVGLLSAVVGLLAVLPFTPWESTLSTASATLES
ncbi:MAG: hypothetical protein M3P01_00435 [Actinomycetota bacterium]|nr:hypothetical protein [Actinomycetota bacterium]